MRFRFNIIIYCCLIVLIFGCNKYLDNEPERVISEKDVFSTYAHFQGFVDQLYEYLVDGNKFTISVGAQMGGETIALQGWNSSRASAEGNYWGLLNGRSIFKSFVNEERGLWYGGWPAIRIANQAIENVDYFMGSEEERNWLLGQAYFFRAYFHMEIWRAFGSIPYIDEVLDSDFQKPRYFSVKTESYGTKYGCQAVAERIIEDLDKATLLLPSTWPDAASQWGRVTKGAALAFKAKTLLTAGSPLFNEFSGENANVNYEYMKRAAEAAGEVLKLSDEGIYELTPFGHYKDMFCKNDGSHPFTKELIFTKINSTFGSTNFTSGIGRTFVPDGALFGGSSGTTESVTQNFVDKYEMVDGSPYRLTYDSNDSLRWENRDPRFRATIYVDGDRAGIADETILELYTDDGNGFSGRSRANGNTLSPYIVHKYWPRGVNRKDGDWNNFYYHTPLMRLADIYLMYAEACYNIIGDPYANSGNYSMSALDAVNVVRNRAGMPNVDVTLTLYNGDFNKLIQNERAVELAFEGHYWFDLRRWKIRPDSMLYDLCFDKQYSYFHRQEIIPFVFENRHWWMPFPQELIRTVKDFPQNPGW